MTIHALIESIVLDEALLTEESLRVYSGGYTLEVLWNPKSILQVTVSEVVRGNFRELLRFIGSSALARVEHEARGYRRSDPAVGRALIGLVRKANAQMGQVPAP